MPKWAQLAAVVGSEKRLRLVAADRTVGMRAG